MASSSEGLVQLVSEALTRLPSSPPPLQKQTPKGLLFEAKAISGQHCGERGLQAILEQPGMAFRVGPPGLQPSQNTAHGLRGLPPPFHLHPAVPLLHSQARQVPRDCQRTDCWEPAVPKTRGTHKADMKNVHPGKYPQPSKNTTPLLRWAINRSGVVPWTSHRMGRAGKLEQGP